MIVVLKRTVIPSPEGPTCRTFRQLLPKILDNVSALAFAITISFYFFLIIRNISDEKPPLVAENPISNYLLSNRQAKTVLNKRVKRQWSQREEDRNEYYEPEYYARDADLESEYRDKKR